MIRLIRILGFLLLAAGAIVILTWMIKPLQVIWPWLLALPLAIRIGVTIAASGLIILFGSLIWERIEEREQDRRLRDE